MKIRTFFYLPLLLLSLLAATLPVASVSVMAALLAAGVVVRLLVLPRRRRGAGA